MKQLHRFNTISEFHQFCTLPKPDNPLISVIDYSEVKYSSGSGNIRWTQNFYSIGLKRNLNGKFNYGQQQYDFDAGVLAFVAPNQMLNIEIKSDVAADPTGWLLVFHPDFLWGTNLCKCIKEYDFFHYSVNEALHMSTSEEQIIDSLVGNIQAECQSSIDKFSQGLISAQIEVLLRYAERFYERQFITRKIANHHILIQLENLLSTYFDHEKFAEKGLLTVEQIATELHLSPNYLSTLLKVTTGQSTQQHIQNKLIEKAKEKISTTNLTISEIAYELGFEHPASFSKLFKKKTNRSPLEFRNSFYEGISKN